MKYLAALVFLSLILVPTDASAAPPFKPQESANCQALTLDITLLFPGTYGIAVNAIVADGPWILYHGLTPCLGCMYKGCPFVPTPTFQFGPFTGPLLEIFNASQAEMMGGWQVVSATKTSNAVINP